MLVVSPERVPSSLGNLSRNTSVISTSSSSSGSTFDQPLRPIRPLRTFSAPRRSRSRDPQSPGTPRNSSRPPAFITKELALLEDGSSVLPKIPDSRSRQNSVAGKFSPNDFTFDHHNVLGEGSYSEVLKGTHNLTKKVYAVKIVDKKLLMRKGKVNTAHEEKNSLTRLGKNSHPGLIKLHWTFQDEWSLYFVLDLAPNGDLQTKIQRLGSLSIECSRFYISQILDGIQWMHQRGVLHRDLKPENVLLDSEMRVKLTDFGTSKCFDENMQDFRATTWVGTAQYIAPELIMDTYTCKSSDIWAVGCMLFQCISGNFPFLAATQYLMWEEVRKLAYEFPSSFDGDARDLVERILLLDPEKRLGAGAEGTDLSPNTLRAHPFLTGGSWTWETLWNSVVPPMAVGIYSRPSELDNHGVPLDAGAAWDALASSDGIPWADSTEGHLRMPVEFVQLRRHSDEIAPHEVVVSSETTLDAEDETLRGRRRTSLSRDRNPIRSRTRSPSRESSGHSVEPPASGFPKQARGSFSTSGSNTLSHSSSSDVEPLKPESKEEVDVVTRIDSRAPVVDPWLATLLPSEPSILSTPVIPRTTLRQRASSILPAVSPIKITPPPVKRRHLVLTSERLICLKLKDGLPPSIKSEVFLNQHRLSVEKKGDREFNVYAGGKSYTYAVEDAALAARWIHQIEEGMDAYRGRRISRS